MIAREQNETFAKWMKLHRGIVFKVARSFAGSASEQDDLAQEMLLGYWAGVFSSSAVHMSRRWRLSRRIS